MRRGSNSTERLVPRVLHVCPDDIDAFTAAAPGWTADFRQLDRGKLAAELLHIDAVPVSVINARFNRLIDQVGTPPEGVRTFAILNDADVVPRWCGYRGTSSSLLSFGADAEFTALSRPGFDTYVISISNERLGEVATSMGVPPPDEVLGPDSSAIVCPDDILRQLRRDLFEIRHASTHLQTPAMGRLLRETCARIPERLAAAVASSHPDREQAPAWVRARARRRAIEFIQEFADQAPPLSAVVRAAEVSERTLQYAFVEYFGITPKAYLQAIRLNAVRRELRVSPIVVRVADVANAWGFWHMGQFAADYRRHFGELPSATLRRACTRQARSAPTV